MTESFFSRLGFFLPRLPINNILIPLL